MLTDEHDGEPFAVIMDANIHTAADAAMWLKFFGGMRGLLARRAKFPSNLQIQAHCPDLAEDDDWWATIDAFREIASDPERRGYAVCAIDLWAVRARLEWGLV